MAGYNTVISFDLLNYLEKTSMSYWDTFRKPEGFLGRICLTGMNRGHEGISRWGMGFYDFRGDETILDVGCGGGAQLSRLLEWAPRGKVYGIDISEEACRVSRKVNRAEIGKRCFVENATVEALPFDDGMFDMACTVESAYFWPSVPAGLLEIKRVLKAGGKLVLILETHDKNCKWQEKVPGMTAYSDDEMVKMFDEAGFSDIRCELKGDNMCVIGTK